MYKLQKILFLTLLFCGSVVSVFGQAQCGGGVLNVGLNTPTIPPGCGTPKTVSFTASSTTGSAETTSYYLWYVDGVFIDSVLGTGGPNRNFIFNSVGTHTVRVVGRTPGIGGCLDTFTRTINIPSTALSGGIVDPPRIATPTLSPVWSFCNTNPGSNPGNTYAINVMTQGTDTLKNYTIIWGDATANATGVVLNPSTPIPHTYNSLGVFNVTIINDNGICKDTIRGTVRNLRPVSTSILPLPAGQLAGCAPHTIIFQDSTQNALPGTVITWNFGTGQSTVVRSENQANTPISYTYPKAASQQCVFTVSITATNTNCPSPGPPSTYSVSPILIYDVDIADVAVAAPLCDTTRSVVLLNNSQLNCEPGPRLWYWDFGDGTNTGWISSQASQIHVFPTFGNYVVMLIDSNFCGTDTDYLTIRVNRIPKTGFTANPKMGCAPLVVTYADTSGGLAMTTRLWTFGTGSGLGNRSDSANNVTYTIPGDFRIRLTATNECGTVSANDSIHVYAKPTVRIRAGNNGCAPFTRTFFDSTINQSPSATYKWTFGNGDSSTLRNPAAVTYNSPGTYPVKLVVSDTCGSDSATINVVVSTVPVANFTADTVCRGDSTVFVNTSVLAMGDNIFAAKWYFGDGDSSTLINPKHRYMVDGTKTVVVRIQTDKGCVDFDTLNTVFVNTSPNVAFTMPARVCDGTVVNFNGTATAGVGTITAYQWTFGAGITDTARVEDTSYVYPGSGTYTVRYKVSNSTGCSFTEVKTLNVDPIPDARPTASVFCHQQFTQFRDSSTVGFANTIDSTLWDFNADNIADSISRNPTFKFGTANTFKVKLRVVTNNGCANTDSINVTINALPVPGITNNGVSKCKQDSFVFGNTTTGAVSYRWRFGDATPDSITGSLADLTKVYPDTGVFLVKMIATSLQGCSDSSSVTINSRPFPVARFTVNDTLSCAPKTFVFTNTSVLADGYVWRVNGSQTTTSFNRPDTTINTSGQTFVVSLIATNIYGCRPDTTQRTIQTIANPTPDFTMSTDSGCGPLHVDFTNTSLGATSYIWIFGNGITSTSTDTAATYLASNLNDSSYSVKLVALNGPGCKDSISKTVTVFPKPVSSFTQTQTANCGPLPITFTNTSVHKFGGTINDFIFNWRFGNGDSAQSKDPLETFIASPIQDTVYAIRLIATTLFGCSDTAQSTVRVYPNPRSSFTVNNDNGCGPLGVNFTNTSIPNDTGNISIMSFNWNFDNGLTSTAVNPGSTFIANLTKDTIYRTQLIATSEHGCKDTSYRNILVFPKPLAEFTMPNDSGCSPYNLVFTNTSTPYDTGNISMMSFVWDLGNGFGNITQDAFSQYISKQYLDSSYTVKLYATSEHGCKDTVAKNIVSHPIPVAIFSNNISQGCGPLGVQFTSSSILAASYRWNFGDGGVSQLSGPLHTFNSYPLFDTMYSVSFSVLSVFGCESDTVRGNIIARYRPVADFISGADSICSSGPVSFTNQSIGAIANSWNFGNGTTSTAINPTGNFAGLADRDTTYTIRLIVTSPYSCKDTAIKQVTVNPLPQAQFNVVVPGCTPLPVAFSNTSLRGVSHQWDFGDGSSSTATNPNKVFTNGLQLTTQNFLVTLKTISQSGCEDTAKQVVTVYPKPLAAFSSNAFQGCGPLSVGFTNQSAADFSGSTGMTFVWNFGTGDTSSQATPTYSFPPNATKDTIYSIVLAAFSKFGCADTAYNVVRVFPQPTARFAVSDSMNCGPMNVSFTNTSVPNDTGSINIMNFIWDFENGFSSVQRHPSSQFINNGLTDSVFVVKLIASSEHGCKDTTTRTVTVKPKPIAAFTQDRLSGCGPFSVAFTNTSLVSTQYYWSFGNGDTSTQMNPAEIYQSFPLVDSNYTVSLVTHSAFGCISDTVRKVINARYLPVAGFNTSTDTVCNPGSVSFYNTTMGAATNNWNFGNGDSSVSINPVQSYIGAVANDTQFVTRLIVVSSGACRDTAYRTITVRPLPNASFAAITPGCTPLAASLTNTSTGATRYEWEFGDGTTDTTAFPNKIFTGNTPLSNTYYTVTLKAYSAFGCLDTAKRFATIYPQPIVAFTSNVTEGCGPLSVQFSNQSAANLSGSTGMSFDWDFRNGDTSTQKTPQVLFRASNTQDTVFNTRLIGISEYGCRDTLTRGIRVFPKPEAQFVTDITSGCTPLMVNFTNQSFPNDTGTIDIMSFVWNFGNGLTAIGKDALSEFINSNLSDTTFTIRLFASSEHGCRDTSSQIVQIHPKPVASFTQDKISGCGPFTVNFTNTSAISTVYHWNFGDGDSSQVVSPAHIFQSYPLIDSFYTASLVTESALGCISDTAQRTIIGKYIPMASFITSSDSTCNPGTISFFNASVGGATNSWNFGNGNTSAAINPAALFNGPQAKDTTYQVRLVVFSPANCSDTTYKTIKVNPLPVAAFASVAPACTPYPVVFNNTSLRASNYEWDFGDGSTMVGSNPLKIFTNDVALADRNYLVTLKAYTASGCMDTAKRIVSVNPLPLVNYTANKTLRCDTAEFLVINSSQGATTYEWKQADRLMSTQFAPMLYFNAAHNTDSTHNLKLIATTAKGCKDSTIKPITIKPLVVADFNANGSSSCSNLNVVFSNQSRNAASYFWLFGDGTGSPLTSPQHKYTNTGTYDVKLIAYDAFGCSDTAVRLSSVNVFEVPSANFLYSPPTAALPNSTIDFNNLSFISAGNLTHQWVFGDPTSSQNSSSIEHPAHTFSDSGNFEVRLVVNSINNCFDTMLQVVRIRPHPPVPAFTYDPPHGCTPLVVQFTSQAEYTDEYEWTFDDGQTSTDKNPVITFKYPGKYGAFLRVRGPGGERQLRKDEIIEVFGLPRPNFFVTPVKMILPNSTVTLTDISSDAIAFKWRIMSEGQTYFTDSSRNSTYTFTKEGKYDVKLIVRTDKGCLDSLTMPNVVEVIKGGQQFIGNAFTPDGDGINDVFKPVLQGVLPDYYTFEIYNRWGERVFWTHDLDEGWDGTFNGKPASIDAYVWLVKGYYVGNVDFSEEGNVTLIR